MPERIDKELERMRRSGQAPRIINVGSRLYEEIHEEQNPVMIASLVPDGGITPTHTDQEVTEYQGIRVFLDSNKPRDYLDIQE